MTDNADYGGTLNWFTATGLVPSMENAVLHDWTPVTVTLHGRKRHGNHCRRCYKRAVCPQGCGFLRGADEVWICPKCGDEWPDLETFGECEAGKTSEPVSPNGSSGTHDA